MHILTTSSRLLRALKIDYKHSVMAAMRCIDLLSHFPVSDFRTTTPMTA